MTLVSAKPQQSQDIRRPLRPQPFHECEAVDAKIATAAGTLAPQADVVGAALAFAVGWGACE